MKKSITAAEEVDQLCATVRAVALEKGISAYFVGGYVRDQILGRPCKDVDVVVEGLGADVLVAEVARRLGWREPVTFARYGTYQTHGAMVALEVVRARVESYQLTSRKPTVIPASLEEDILRRDFTFNALAQNMEGDLIDMTGTGVSDLKNKRLRTPLDPTITFSDDPLRMLRAARMVAQLGVTPVFGMREAMLECSPRCEILSPERISDELRKILVAPQVRAGLELLAETEVLKAIAPELDLLRGCLQDGRFHRYDVWGHTVRAVEASEANLLVRTATLCHDIGKPATRVEDESGKISFHGHAEVGAHIAAELLGRLRFGGNEITPVYKLVELHMRPMLYDKAKTGDAGVRRMIRDAGELRGSMIAVARADQAASAHPQGTDFDELAERMERLDQPGLLSKRKPVLDGGTIMDTLREGAGPRVGEAQKALEEAVIEGVLDPRDREACIKFVMGWGGLFEGGGKEL